MSTLIMRVILAVLFLTTGAAAQQIIVDGPPASTRRAVQAQPTLDEALTRLAELEAKLDALEAWQVMVVHRIAFLEENHTFRLGQVERLSGLVQSSVGQELRLSVQTAGPASRIVNVTVKQGNRIVKGPIPCTIGEDKTFALAFNTSDMPAGRYDLTFDDPKIPTQPFTVVASK